MRSRVDSQIINGQAFRAIARQFQDEGISLSRDSIRRHFMNHASQDVLSAIQEAEEVNAADLVMQIADIAHDSRAMRTQLRDAGKVRDSIRAGDAELRALRTLTDRIGITDSMIITNINEATDTMHALAYVLRENRELVGVLLPALIVELKENNSIAPAHMFERWQEQLTPNKEIDE